MRPIQRYHLKQIIDARVRPPPASNERILTLSVGKRPPRSTHTYNTPSPHRRQRTPPKRPPPRPLTARPPAHTPRNIRHQPHAHPPLLTTKHDLAPPLTPAEHFKTNLHAPSRRIRQTRPGGRGVVPEWRGGKRTAGCVF